MVSFDAIKIVKHMIELSFIFAIFDTLVIYMLDFYRITCDLRRHGQRIRNL